MTRAEALQRLRAQEAALRAMGVARLSLFGSTARDEAGPTSDVDVVGVLRRDMKIGLVEYIQLNDELASILGTKVDFVSEPVRRARLQAHIDRDRVDVF